MIFDADALMLMLAPTSQPILSNPSPLPPHPTPRGPHNVANTAHTTQQAKADTCMSTNPLFRHHRHYARTIKSQSYLVSITPSLYHSLNFVRCWPRCAGRGEWGEVVMG